MRVWSPLTVLGFLSAVNGFARFDYLPQRDVFDLTTEVSEEDENFKNPPLTVLGFPSVVNSLPLLLLLPLNRELLLARQQLLEISQLIVIQREEQSLA